MIKITQNGKTIVGNNEDSSNPNTMIWFETGHSNQYGVMYVGFDNLFPQGGMNETGLVFDGFSQSNRAVNDTAGKINLSSLGLSKLIMQKCSSVEEVKELLSQYNIAFWASGVLRFVDKTGKYLYVDGDSLIMGQNDWFIQTNKRPYEEKECWRYNKATELLTVKSEASIDFCKSVMDSIHQETNWGGTLYTTIYDIEKMTVDLYYFYDFDNVYSFNLRDELSKGDHLYKMHELLPNNEKANKYYTQYNSIQTIIIDLSKSELKNDSLSVSAIKDTIFNSGISKYIWLTRISNIGDQHSQKDELKIAISYYKLNVELFPEIWYVFDSLGLAYMENRQYQLALDSYNNSIRLNPNNLTGMQQIEKLKKLIEY